ncbi:MAG: methylmalonyl-CoA mutase [Flavobacteriaceae bacterium]|nr:methylmalonyl-CoA mutase [Flavobacteriaceae bacterium]
MSENLFKSFDPVAPKAWKQKIQVDLKGADYNDTLIWKTEEGIDVKPFYTKEDRSHQGVRTSFDNYMVCQSVFVDDEKIAHKIASDALSKGADTIQFVATKNFDFQSLLANIQPEASLYFKLQFLDAEFVKEIIQFCGDREVIFQIDPIGELAEQGNWFQNQQKDIEALQQLLGEGKLVLSVSLDVYQNAGATITQQLAYALAHANEYINLLGDDAAKATSFSVAVGGNYFFEIAKIRALRILWESLCEGYGIEHQEAHIFTTPSLRNKSIYDYNVNLLRTTSETMSAILGSSNTVANLPYDKIYNRSNEFGERISRNQLLVLNNESGFKTAKEIVDGTYYIESLTDQLAEKALNIFKQIEKGGGFLSQLFEGTIQRKISESHEAELEKFESGKLRLLGTNFQPNPEDRMKDNLQLYPFAKKRNTKTLITPITGKRLAEKLEKERLDQES